MDNAVVDGALEEPLQRPNGNKVADSDDVTNCGIGCTSSEPNSPNHNESNSSPLDGCMNTASILLEPSEYFFDDDFAVPFDAHLRDDSSLRHQNLIDDSDEGISSSGILAPPHSRSDSCLFGQLDSGESGRSNKESKRPRNFDLFTNHAGSKSALVPLKEPCYPDSTSARNCNQSAPRIHRTMSADFSTGLHDIGVVDKILDNYAITFSEHEQISAHPPSSLTTSWIQNVLESSCCPRVKELLKRTAEALDYRLAWGEVQLEAEDGNHVPLFVSAKKVGRIQRSTSHGNILTAASLAGMRRALATIKVVAPKTYRSVGVSTSDGSCGGSSIPDTTIATETTTWARIRSSRESLNNRKTTSNASTVVIPSPPKSTIPESAATWRAMKEVAGSELTTWGQLRRTASLGNRKAQQMSTPLKANNRPLNMHSSMLTADLEGSFRPPISQKAMHRYSGTLLEIFMRARARDLISSSCPSSTGTDTAADDAPGVVKCPGHPAGVGNASTNVSLQTNVMAGSGNDKVFKTGIPGPKFSQPPLIPPRKSSVPSNNRRQVLVNRSIGGCYASRMNSDLPEAALLTMSADPESECMTRLREANYVSRLKNPRAAIVYPGVGRLGIPKPSRIESNTFLSHTLPDLSLLGKAAAQEAKSGTPTTRVPLAAMSRRSASMAPDQGRNYCGAGHRYSEIVLQPRILSRPGSQRTSDVVSDARMVEIMSKGSQVQVGKEDRAFSEPDAIDKEQAHLQQRVVGLIAHKMPPLAVRSRSQSIQCKKSVSFNGNINGLQGNGSSSACRSLDAKVIPKSWGLYGHDPPPLAVFQPLSDDVNDVSSTTKPSDVDVRYHAMVMDVIRAVQETIAYFCQSTVTSTDTGDGSNITASSSGSSGASLGLRTQPSRKAAHRRQQNSNNSSGSGHHGGQSHRYYSSLLALGGSGRSSLVAVVNPLMVLISDGLLPPQTRAIFASKPKSRIWALVEDSCRPSASLGTIEHHILNEALNQVKAITGAITEKLRFRAFVCACLNQRALLVWLNSLVSNEALLKRYYCDGAFIRQCRTALQGLYADLTTHVEQLLNYPFNFDLAAEAKRPMGHTYAANSPLHSAKPDAALKTGAYAKEARNSTTRASSTPAKVIAKAATPSEVRPSSVAKAPDTRIVRPRVQPANASQRRAPKNINNNNIYYAPGSAETQALPTENCSPTLVSPLRPLPLSSPNTSLMRDKLRTAFSTFKRSMDTVTTNNYSHQTSGLVAQKCASPPPPLPPHRSVALASSSTPSTGLFESNHAPIRVFHNHQPLPPPF